MKKLFMSFIFVCVLFAQTFAQQVTENATLTASGTAISKETTGQTTTYAMSSYNIGKEVVGTTTKIYRTYLEFSLAGIPTNATIQTVTVYITNGKNWFTQKFTNISSVNPYDYQSCWEAVGNSSTIESGISYNASTYVSNALKTQFRIVWLIEK